MSTIVPKFYATGKDSCFPSFRRSDLRLRVRIHSGKNSSRLSLFSVVAGRFGCPLIGVHLFLSGSPQSVADVGYQEDQSSF